jgi:phenylacetate-coenzyme A ligase PaaK-like adenylate-forming protein
MENKVMPSNRFWDEKWETLSIDEKAHIQLKKLKQLLTYANKNSPFYRRHFKEATFDTEGINSLDDYLGRGPFVNKTILMDEQTKNPPFGDLLTVNSAELVRLY